MFLPVSMREIGGSCARRRHLAGSRSLVDAVRKSLRQRVETREQMMGAGPSSLASNTTETPRHVKFGARGAPEPE